MSAGAWVLVGLVVVGMVLRAIAPVQRSRRQDRPKGMSGGHVALGAMYEGSPMDWDD